MNEMPRTDHGGMQHITLAEENHQQMWDDTLMMTVLPLAKIGKLLNRPEYVEEATYQFLLHVQNLMDKETGCGSTAGAMTVIITSLTLAGRAATAG